MITQLSDYLEQAIESLLSDLQDESYTKFDGLLYSFVRRMQEVEDAAWLTINLRLIDNATGGALDTLGRLVGQPRTVDSDDDYRILIKARIKANASKARSLDLYALGSAILGSPAAFTIRDWANVIHFDGLTDNSTLAFSASVVGKALQNAKRSGASIHYIYSDKPELETFTWGNEPDDPGLESLQGWGDSVSGSIGGYWASVYRPSDVLRNRRIDL